MPLPHLHLLPGMHGTPELYRPFTDALGNAPHTATHYPDDCSPTAESVLAAIADSTPTDRPYVLLAESFSGMFAALYAATRPDNLVGLVLVNTFLKLPMGPLTCGVTQVKVRPPWVLSSLLLVDGDSSPELRDLTRSIVGRLDPRLVAGRFRLLYRTDATRRAARITAPTLVLHGANDVFVWPYNSRRIERHIPGSQRVKLPGPHLLVQTHPQESLRTIEQWWERHGIVQSPPPQGEGLIAGGPTA
ncbi:Alpha/beta hydrolase family protein [Posidoniimonas corsicana]|uniref:Alpha/beta hydrolase family protein n=1 Tax=Posidoniimonas corsicana TaxID=1938618 RepID=A0A5C5V4Q4_9BACT|nr:alpha/beta hydrolase [Posidoniimonas corsicana]TWT33518.1 Alpha/beta hydrolase family protein [Posidoniimonas corsicana]